MHESRIEQISDTLLLQTGTQQKMDWMYRNPCLSPHPPQHFNLHNNLKHKGQLLTVLGPMRKHKGKVADLPLPEVHGPLHHKGQVASVDHRAQ